MISHKHKCIFVHIPKCAGTSIEKSLGHFEDYAGRDQQDHSSIRMVEPVNSKTFSSTENMKELLKRFLVQIKPAPNPRNKYTVSREQYEKYFKFTIVRNPWARVHSWYKNVTRDELHRAEMGISSKIKFYDFLETFKYKTGLRPQTFWIKNYKGEIPLDYIGRFENLSSDFEKVCNLMNIESLKLPHELKRTCNDYRDAYNDKTRDLISRIYKEEIALFGYSFDS
jgi:hypothetical protein